MTLYLDMAGPLIPNSAPVFSDTAVALVCQFDTTYILNSASDADGDRLTYSFGTPYAGDYNQLGNAPTSNNYNPPGTSFTPPPTSVTYASGYSTALPFGAGSTATLNATTGLSTYIVNAAQGFYVVAVDVNEYRNINGTEVLVGRTRRDLQLVVRQCPAGNAPTIQSAGGTGNPTGSGGRSFTVEEGQTLTFPINANTNPGGSSLTTRVNSVLLDGSGSINASYNGDQGLRPAGSTTGTVTVAGSGPVNGTFSFTPSCGMARSTSYDVLTTATVVCTTKSKSEVFQITVTKPAAPTAIAGTTQLCDVSLGQVYTATGPLSATYNWHIVGGTIVSGQGTQTVQVRWNSVATTAQLSVKGISAFGCRTDSVVQNVTIRPLANPVVTPSAPSICRGASTTLTVTPATGLTYTIAGGAQTVTGTTLTVSPTATTVYTVTASDGTCTSTTQVTVTVVPPPTVTPGTAVTVCSGQTAQLGAAPVAGLTYSWSPATGLSNPNIANPTLQLSNNTGANITQTYTLTVTNTAGCVSTGTVVVTVTPPLNVSAGTSVSTCSGQTAQLGVAPIAGLTYSWSPTTGLSNPTIANPTVTLTNTTGVIVTTTYTLTATNAAGCISTTTVTVTVNPAVIIPAFAPEFLCSGQTLQFNAPVLAGYTYSWTPTTGLSDPTIANPVLTAVNTTAAPISTLYTLLATNAQGCTATQAISVVVVPLPIANAGANQTLCSGVASAPLGIAPVAGNTYRWTPATGLSSATVAQPTVTLTNSGTTPITQTYTLTVTGPFAGNPVTGGTSCTSTSTVTVTVNPTPVATPGPAVSFCSGGSAQLGAAPVAGVTYSWSPDSGLSDATIANPIATGTNTTNAPITRIFTLTATLGTCTNTATVAVTINPAAQALPGVDRSVCSGIGTALGAAPVAGNTYLWTPATGLSSATVANPTATLTNTTGADITQTYTLVTTNTQGCTGTGTVTVTVKSAAVADAGPDLTVCSGATGLVGTPALPGYTYSWITTPQAGISIDNGSLAQPTFTVTNTTAQSFFRILVLNVTAPNGCTSQDQVQININPAAVAEAGPNYTTCSGQPVTLGPLNNPVVVGNTYAWTPAIGLSSTAVPNPVATLTNTTGATITQKYYLTVTTSNGCVARDSVTVTVTPAAVVDAGADQTVCADQRVTLGTPAQAGYTYTWTPATGLSSASTAQPVLNTTGLNTTTAPLTLKYYLNARTTSGCVGRDSVSVTINPRPAAEGITGSASVCPTVTGVAYSVVNPTGTTYRWIITGGTQASGGTTASITVDWGTAGTGLVQVYQVNALGCSSDTTDFAVRINPILQTPTPNGPGNVTATAPNNAVCQGDGPYTYATTPYTNGSVYAWTIIGGTQVSTNLNTVSVQWNPVTVSTIGKIVVTETSNPASGVRCLGTSDTLRVRINPTPLSTLTLTGPARVCQGSPISFTLPGGFAGSTYAFQLDNQPQTTTGNTLSLPAQTTPGTYVVSVRETSAQGCAGALITTSFTVDPAPVAATITGPAFLCDFPTPAQPGIQYSVPNTSGATYQWTVVGGAIATGQGSSQITVYFNSTAPSYSVSVTETSAFGCAGPANTLRILRNTPSLALALASVAETSNNSVVLTLNVASNDNTPAANLVQVQRRVTGSGAAFVTVGTVPATATTYTDASADAAANSYEYQLELTNGCGTLLRSALLQTIRLQAMAAPGTGGRNQGTVDLSWNAYVGFPVQGYRIYRTLDGGTPELLSTVLASTLTATVPNGADNSATGAGFNQVFRVVAVSTDATPLFSNSNTTSVDFANTVKTYNIITPNNDGKNDVLVFDNITLYPGNTLTIFNRWGREVYNTTNYQNNWGGTELSGGNYYYLLKLPNGTTTKGWFEIVK
ncbi:gliding motility-associated C-terminal domain-containing protein [Hymenobacter sp. ASUV-10]|uniref:Gliding motility-associated C-terminal domain-containing protein n=1 Tax=Hymenobacter aranciens TaxID=3063996 RepID=A0ABT9BI04_9BACT|nr:gliding motility-associated C-terminal domain-containing protein [Hymenobacter sp. ASUV-10]MDO7876266.1 gliding motility-associated C-terminal domain-containing protein [Hymenobacter sp. ASUV-10]